MDRSHRYHPKCIVNKYTLMKLNPLQKDKPYWIKSIEDGQGVRNANGFTTVGKPKMASKQYNSPLEMYGEEALEEIMKEGTLK